MFRKLENYNAVIFPHYRYATFNCDDLYINKNFDDILRIIGKYHFNDTEIGLNALCSKIRDEINKEWKLNSFKKRIRLKKVSTNQIKSIRRAFNKIRNKNEKFIRIPFDVVSILFYIMQLFNKVSNINSSTEINLVKIGLNNSNIGNYIYRYHTQVFQNGYLVRKQSIEKDSTLYEKYEWLYARLNASDSIMNMNFNSVNWNNADDYIIR